MRAKHWMIIGLIAVSGVSLYWAHEIDLIYGVWGQYQKTPYEKFVQRRYKMFSSMAREWDGKCSLAPAAGTNTEVNRQRQSDARYAARHNGNVAALYCSAEWFIAYNDLPNKQVQVYEALKLAELISGKLHPEKQILMEEAVAQINMKNQDDGAWLSFLTGRVEEEYHGLKDAGVLDPKNHLSWPEPFKAFNTALTQKMRVEDNKKLARNWDGLCVDNPFLTRNQKWTKLRRLSQLRAAQHNANAEALYCSIDVNLADTSMHFRTQALEDLMLVKMQLGALPQERQVMLDELQSEHTQTELALSKESVEIRYDQLTFYGAIEARPEQ